METIVLDLDNYIDMIHTNLKKNSNVNILLRLFMEVLKVINSNNSQFNIILDNIYKTKNYDDKFIDNITSIFFQLLIYFEILLEMIKKNESLYPLSPLFQQIIQDQIILEEKIYQLNEIFYPNTQLLFSKTHLHSSRNNYQYKKKINDLQIELDELNKTKKDMDTKENVDEKDTNIVIYNSLNEVIVMPNINDLVVLNKTHLLDAQISNLNLKNKDLSYGLYSKANMSNSNLININMDHSNLVETLLTDSYLLSVHMEYCEMNSINLQNTTIENSTISNTSISKPNLLNSKIIKSNLSTLDISNTYLTKLILDDNICDTINLVDLFFIDLEYTNSTIKNGNWKRCSYQNSDIVKNKLLDTTIIDSHFTNCKWNDCSIHKNNLDKVGLKEMTIENNDWVETQISTMDLGNSVIKLNKFTKNKWTEIDSIENKYIGNTIENSTILSSTFYRDIFDDTKISYCTFNSTNFYDSFFNNSNLIKVELIGNILNNMVFYDLELIDISIKNSSIRFSHLSNGLINKIDLLDSTINNTILYDLIINHLSILNNIINDIECNKLYFNNGKIENNTITKFTLVNSEVNTFILNNNKIENIEIINTKIDKLTNTNKNDIEQATISKSSILNSDLIHYQVKNIIVSNSYIEHTNIVSSYLDDLTLDTNILIDSIFSNLHMNHINLYNIVISSSKWYIITLSNSNIVNTVLINNEINDLDLVNCNIDYLYCENSILHNIYFDNCNINNMNLKNCQLYNIDFSNVSLVTTYLLELESLSNCYYNRTTIWPIDFIYYKKNYINLIDLIPYEIYNYSQIPVKLDNTNKIIDNTNFNIDVNIDVNETKPIINIDIDVNGINELIDNNKPIKYHYIDSNNILLIQENRILRYKLTNQIIEKILDIDHDIIDIVYFNSNILYTYKDRKNTYHLKLINLDNLEINTLYRYNTPIRIIGDGDLLLINFTTKNNISIYRIIDSYLELEQEIKYIGEFRAFAFSKFTQLISISNTNNEVHLYMNQHDSIINYRYIQKIKGKDTNKFGYYLSISNYNNYIAISSIDEFNIGCVHLYYNINEVWTKHTSITSHLQLPYDKFGNNTYIDNDYLIISGTRDDNQYTNIVYLYNLSTEQLIPLYYPEEIKIIEKKTIKLPYFSNEEGFGYWIYSNNEDIIIGNKRNKLVYFSKNKLNLTLNNEQ